MEINKLNFEQFKSERIVNPFEDLDVNSDGKINSEDKNAANDTEIFNQIFYLLNEVDEENTEDIEQLIDDTDCINLGKAGAISGRMGGSSISLSSSSDDTESCSGDKCSETNPESDQKNKISTSKKLSLLKAWKKSKSSKSSKKKQHYTISYKETTTLSDRTRVTKYNSAGEIISYIDTLKDGTQETAKYRYYDDGSYAILTKNKTTGVSIKTKYSANGKIKYTVTQGKRDIYARRATTKQVYSYNSDGSYTITTTKGKRSNRTVETTKYDANGKQL